jgi:hypothetical protein
MAETFTADDIETAASGVETTAADSSPADTTTSETASPAASASVAEVDPVNDPGWGQIPTNRRQSILDNARKKARAERESELNQEWESKTGWAKDIDQSDAAILREWNASAKQDPGAFVMSLLSKINGDPTHGPRVRSEMARILGSQRQAAPAEDPMPQPDIPTDTSNGKPVVYSAERQLDLWKWQQRQFQSEMKQALAPFQQDRDRSAQTQQLVAMQAQADAYGANTLKSLVDLPQFKEQKEAIAAAYAAMAIKNPRTGQMEPDPNDPRSEGEKLRDAYLSVVVPKLSQVGHQQAVTTLNRKANASTVNPASSSSTEPFDHKSASWEESLKHEWNKRKNG